MLCIWGYNDDTNTFIVIPRTAHGKHVYIVCKYNNIVHISMPVVEYITNDVRIRVTAITCYGSG